MNSLKQLNITMNNVLASGMTLLLLKRTPTLSHLAGAAMGDPKRGFLTSLCIRSKLNPYDTK